MLTTGHSGQARPNQTECLDRFFNYLCGSKPPGEAPSNFIIRFDNICGSVWRIYSFGNAGCQYRLPPPEPPRPPPPP
jgi:hypothetical protein